MNNARKGSVEQDKIVQIMRELYDRGQSSDKLPLSKIIEEVSGKLEPLISK